MGFLSNLVSSAVKTALTPVAIVKDAVNLATGDDATATSNLLESAAEDLTDSVDDLTEGDLL